MPAKKKPAKHKGPKPGTPAHDKWLAKRKALATLHRKQGQALHRYANNAFNQALDKLGVRKDLRWEDRREILKRFYVKVKELKAEADLKGETHDWKSFLLEESLSIYSEITVDCPTLADEFAYFYANSNIPHYEGQNVRVKVVSMFKDIVFNYTSWTDYDETTKLWKVKPGFIEDPDWQEVFAIIKRNYSQTPYPVFMLVIDSVKVNQEKGYCECTYEIHPGDSRGHEEHPEGVRRYFEPEEEGEEEEPEEEKGKKGKKGKTAKERELELELKVKEADLKGKELDLKGKELELKSKQLDIEKAKADAATSKLDTIKMLTQMLMNKELTKKEYNEMVKNLG